MSTTLYQEHFGLNESPFSIAPDPRFLFMSEQHQEALAHLLFGIQNENGFVLLTGEVGTGKTTVCRCLLEQIPENTNVAFVLNPRLSVHELLATICDDLGITYPQGNESVKLFIDIINTFLLDTHGKGRKTILIIEEAQNLSADVLEQVRLLTNLETNDQKLLQIILIGQPELRDMLSRTELRQLSQRITARYHLAPLTKDEVVFYVRHRLSVAGAKSQIFTSQGLEHIYRLSKGVPRLINIICDRALLGAYARGETDVDRKMLDLAAQEVFGSRTSGKKFSFFSARRKMLSATGVFMILCVLIGVLYIRFQQPSQELNAAETPRTPAPQKPLKAESLPPFTLPEGISTAGSMDLAYMSVFAQWNLTYRVGDSRGACGQAQSSGLRCLDRRGSLNMLKSFNVPAILKLKTPLGETVYAAITALDNKEARIEFGPDVRRVTLSELGRYWAGEFTILWKVPPHYVHDLKQGDRGSDVQWIDEQLAAIQKRPQRVPPPSIFDQEMVQTVRAFQLSEGLVPDGVVGPATLLRIMAAVDQVPALN